MVQPQESFVKVPAVKVIEACEKQLQAELLKHQENQECMIREKMRGGWFRPKMDRDAAIEALFGKLWNDVNVLKIIGAWHINRLFELKNLAKLACANDGEVNVNASDAKLLVL